MDIAPTVYNLAREALSDDLFLEASIRARTFIEGSATDKRLAKLKLAQLVKSPSPKPLLYLMHEFLSLPRTTRNCIRYLGDYLDMLTKEMAYEFFDKRARSQSFGRNARELGKNDKVKDLCARLVKYGEFLYTPGKHDFSLPSKRSHRFSVEEVVFVTYVTLELGKQIQAKSKLARELVEGDNNPYVFSSGKWGSSNRVYYSSPTKSDT
jgi:hypothetical protein